MNLTVLNQKRMNIPFQRLLLMMAAVMMALATFTACVEDENGGGDDNPKAQTGTYTGEKDGTKFTLKITKGAGTSDSPVGNNYELTASSKKSDGSIIDDEDGILRLQPSNSSSVFFVTVHDKSITSIYEPVTWSDGSTSKAPGVFPGNFPYVPDYNIRYSCRQMYGEMLKGRVLPTRIVWDEANSIYASTDPDYYSFGECCVNDIYYQWFGGDNLYVKSSCSTSDKYYLLYSSPTLGPYGPERVSDREILGKTCSVYDNNGRISAYYRCLLFLEINKEGEVVHEYVSFSEEVKDYDVPPGYTRYCTDCE